MSNFKIWYELAGDPCKAEDGWFDLDTGHYYNPEINYSKKTRKFISDVAQDARAVAKFFGGKSLAGSVKQKEWGEKIRAGKLGAMTEDAAVLACRPAGLGRNASFWINNRNRNASDFSDFFLKQDALRIDAKKLEKEGDNEAYAKVASEYNALTKDWGFE